MAEILAKWAHPTKMRASPALGRRSIPREKGSEFVVTRGALRQAKLTERRAVGAFLADAYGPPIPLRAIALWDEADIER